MKCVLSIAAILAAVGVTSTRTITTSTDVLNVGKDSVNMGRGVVGGRINGVTGSNVLPYYSTMALGTANLQEGHDLIGEAGTNKQTQCETYKALNTLQQQECDVVNFMSKNPIQRPKFTIDKQTNPIPTGFKGVIDSPGSIPGASTQQRHVKRVKNPAIYIIETCTKTWTLGNLSCKHVLKVACDPEHDGCNQGGIVSNSWVGDMVTSFTPDGAGNYILQFDTIADNYWGGRGAAYDHNLTFDIHDVGLITYFALTRVASDDWLMVKVNGNLVYVGPRGSDRPEVYSSPPVFESSSTRLCTQTWDDQDSGWQCSDTGGGGWWGGGGGGNAVSYQPRMAVGGGWNCVTGGYRTGMVQYCATRFSDPELSTNWSFGLNVDIKPYLKNGSNMIFMWTIAASGGEEAIQLTTRQLCPRSYYDQWDNSQCAPLGQRAQR